MGEKDKNQKQYITRRKFIKNTTAAFASITLLGNLAKGNRRESKMILSFYMDDTRPDTANAERFREFLDFCRENGVRGESSVILGYSGKSMARDPDKNQKYFLRLADKSYKIGIDSHMELMTHNELFDFNVNEMKKPGIHEGLWLHEPAISKEEYYKYFSNIIAEGERAGIQFTGLTWPGCGCEACTLRYKALKEAGQRKLNDGVIQALMDLAKEGKFRGDVIPLFYGASETDFGIIRKASDGKYGIYELKPNAMDRMGLYEDPTKVNADYYITEDGKSGMIIKHLENDAPYCMWYTHWQGINPDKKAGWEAFTTVIRRIRQHLGDRVVWMRPSDIVSAYHNENGWSFTVNL